MKPHGASLITVSDDLLSQIVDYLQPGDFYKFKVALDVDDGLYWYNDRHLNVDLVELAIDNDCNNLFRFATIEKNCRITQIAILSLLCQNHLQKFQPYIYQYSILVYQNAPLINDCILYKNNYQLLNVLIDDKSWHPTPEDCRMLLDPENSDTDWGTKIGTRYNRYSSFVRLHNTGFYNSTYCMNVCIECNMFDEFEYLVRKGNTVSSDQLDRIYESQRWCMFATVFRYTPRLIIDYLFGDYHNSTDPQLISHMRNVLHYMRVHDRKIFTTVLEKYHIWLWNFLSHRRNTLSTIDAIVRLQLFEFKPKQYIHQALCSIHPEYLTYLITRGATFELQDVFDAARYNYRYATTVYNSLVVRSRDEILAVLILLMILILAWIIKIEKTYNSIQTCSPCQHQSLLESKKHVKTIYAHKPIVYIVKSESEMH